MQLEIDINPRYRHVIRIMVAALVGLSIFSLVYLVTISTLAVSSLPALQYNTEECVIDNVKGDGRVFRIHGLAKINLLLSEYLCKKTPLDNNIKKVILQWNQDDITNSTTLSSMRYDLVALKPDRLNTQQFKLLSNYVKIAQYGQYSSFLISLTSRPIISRIYLADQTIGLLSKESSFSGHIIPKAFFRRENVNVSTLSLKYYPSHAALRKALETKEVSLIASYWQEDKDSLRFPKAKKLMLDYDIESSSWFLNRDYINTQVHCAVEEALRYQSQRASSTYFKKIDVVLLCDKGGVK